MEQEGNVATVPADTVVESTPGTTTVASTVESTTSPGTATQAASDNSEKRIADLTSLWNKEQALAKKNGDEVARLQGLLAQAVSDAVGFKATISELEQGQSGTVTDLKEKHSSAEATVAALTAENTTLKAQVTTLKFIKDNSDLAAYADIFPETEDINVLTATASRIRDARQSDKDKLKDALTTQQRGGQTPRVVASSMSARDIQTYLAEAQGNPAEFEKRRREVIVMTGGQP